MASSTQLLSFAAPLNAEGTDMFGDDVLNCIRQYIHASTPGYIHPGHAVFQQAERIISTHYETELESFHHRTNATACAVVHTTVTVFHQTQTLCSNDHRDVPEADLLHWLSILGSNAFSEVRSYWQTNQQFVAGPEEEKKSRGISLFMTSSKHFNPQTEQDWASIQVVGQYGQDESENYQDGLLELCKLASGVFAWQPTRLFLHGLYIRRQQVEQWVFDRSGLYCWDTFVVRDTPDLTRYLGLVLGYRMMTDNQLGNSTSIERDRNGSYIVIGDTAVSSEADKKLYIQENPISLRQTLVSPGTTAYLARLPPSDRWDRVVKFKWRLASDGLEEDMLQLSNEKGVQGVVSLDYYKAYPEVTTAQLRQGVHCGHYRRLLDKASAEKSSNTPGIVNYTEETQNKFQNRSLVVFVTSPAGRHLNTFRTRLELLLVLQDAIIAHRSLYQNAGIIHQDISDSNIIIVDCESAQNAEDVSRGMLIDLDVALDLSKGPGRPGTVIGKWPFIAIGKLQLQPRTYRHDLESFLYVLLWILIVGGKDDPPNTSVLQRWDVARDDEATEKLHFMAKENFPTLLAELPSQFRCLGDLAEKLRALLFPVLEDGSLFTGSGDPADELYDVMMAAFEEAIIREKTAPPDNWIRG